MADDAGRWAALVLVGLLAALALFAGLEAVAVHTVAVNSDGATVVLEGQSLATGHLTLAGWALSLDSFWTVDAPFYALGVVLVGTRAVLMVAVPSAIAVLVVVTAAVLACEGVRRGRLAAATTVVALLGLPSPALAFFLLQGPWHVATTLWCLVAFWALGARRTRWGAVVGAVFLALGLLGDAETVVYGIIPVMGAGAVEMARRRSWRAGLFPFAVASGSVVAALAARLVALAIGTFSVAGVNPLAKASQIATNLGHIATYGAAILGVGTMRVPFASIGQPAALQALHVTGLVAVIAGVATATVTMIRAPGARGVPSTAGASDQFLDDMLVLGFFADLVSFVFLARTGSGDYARYLTAGVVFGSVLAGRLAARIQAHLAAARRGPARRPVAATTWRLGVTVTAAVVLAGFVAGVVHEISQPVPAQPASLLARFLAAHHLHVGIGDYWSASLTTVESGGSVAVRPVIANSSGRLVRYDKQSLATWYSTPFQFLVIDTGRPWGRVDAASATATFGRPSAVDSVGIFRVFVWPHHVRVSTHGAAAT